ncbi:outer membrane lipoprotein carrier protein LolA [Gemmatirosa kalamazoonensis]|uniref:Outer membrane lipoprotein carrier protein LolA n=1 Tax=Gemmatirosa kalamazoonensis TaxID=861299 RepID=W0RM12_9BACT|nr:outer membrane lipoprotein carrier protein LolA [Gemmatirosa kalamazoonensis]AHG90478.1 outer membrane lipoprotein carrier protein LolA [Gemmatirosa kalamazoonensis]
MRLIHIPAVLGLLTAATVGAQTPAATIDRAARAFKQAGTVRATFEQTLNNPLTGNQSKSTGELALAQPGKLSLRFTGVGDRVVSDGKYLWVYLPSAAPGQVLKLPATSKSGVGLDVIDDLLTSPRTNYDVADGGAATIDGRATHAVILTPKREGQGITKAQVWVDDASGALRQVVLTQDTGLERTWHITSWTPNAKLAKSTFTFDVPAGARVVDQDAFRGAR